MKNMIATEVSYSEIFTKEVSKTLQTLEEFKILAKSEIKHKQIKEMLNAINQDVSTGIDKIQENLVYLMQNVDWNRFNLSFFGETNAGKSTLLEALLRGNGELIGDGRKDYTQTLGEKKYGEVTLLDLPGIEGNEEKYISEIKRGIEKSHVVFFVIGTNKEPEEETLQKIRSYLKDQAKVYSIINVRGKPSTYKYKKEIYDANIQKIEARTIEKFRRILGNHYVDNLVVNAHLSFLALGNPNREDLINDQQKLMEVFSNKRDAYSFSNLLLIERTIHELSISSMEEISLSNTYKFFGIFEEIIERILKGKNDFDTAIKALKNHISTTIVEVERSSSKYRNEIINLIDRKLEGFKSDLHKIVYEGIDQKSNEENLKRRLTNAKKTFEKSISSELNDILGNMRNEITDAIKQLHNRMDLEFKFSGIGQSDFNIGDILKKVEVNVKYVLGQILDVGLSIGGVIIAFVANPVLGIVSGVVSLVKKIWDWFFGDPNKRKREAKNKAYHEINNTVNKVKKEVLLKTEKELKNLESSIKKQVTGIKTITHEIENLSYAMDGKITELDQIKVKISKALVANILKKPVEFAFFDIGLQSGVLIGENIPMDTASVFRLKMLNTFSSTGKYFDSLENDIDENHIIYDSQDEFTFQSTSNLINYLKMQDPYFPIKGVRRKES